MEVTQKSNLSIFPSPQNSASLEDPFKSQDKDTIKQSNLKEEPDNRIEIEDP